MIPQHPCGTDAGERHLELDLPEGRAFYVDAQWACHDPASVSTGELDEIKAVFDAIVQ